MHIPDGYLGPQTYVPAYAAAIPIWIVASAKLKKTLAVSRVPLLALGAAFCFVIMMFNIPIPGGTTGHAVGGVLVAILLGPWAAVLAVSLALLVQALLFGDGGVTCLGANCLTMAVVMPFVGWGVYRLLMGSQRGPSRKQWIVGAIAGYVGLNAAAFVTAILLGVQPAIAHDAAGHALYCPFGLLVTIPAMMFGHLAFFGFVEAIATGFVLAYLGRTDPALLEPPDAVTTGPRPVVQRLAIGLLVLAVLTPLGLYLPSLFHAGSAWGEWGPDEIGQHAGYVPSGLKRLDSSWHALMPDYALPNQGSSKLPSLSLTYIGSAVLGVLVIGSVVLTLRNQIAKR